MCGIIGYVGPRDAVTDVILPGLMQVEERGYDSFGVAGIINGSVKSVRAIRSSDTESRIAVLLRDEERLKPLEGARTAIGHTRWATHGAVTENNAHPHHDCHERVWLAHNGVINNYAELRDTLKGRGHAFTSETDTEVIAHLIEEELIRTATLEDAVRAAIVKLDGTYGLVVMDRERPDELVVARLGSPLLIGLGDGETFVASLEDAFDRFTKRVVELPDGEVVTVRAEGYSGTQRKEIISQVEEAVSTGDYAHFMLKEIHEQVRVARSAVNHGGRLDHERGDAKLGGLEAREEELLRARHLRIVACGTAYYASLYGARLLEEVGGFETVQAVVASEARPRFFPKDTAVLGVSQSGETYDTLECIREAKRQGQQVFSIVNRVGKALARETACGVYTNAGIEKGVASTKVFLAQGIALSLLAMWFGRRRGHMSVQEGQALGQALNALPEHVERLIAEAPNAPTKTAMRPEPFSSAPDSSVIYIGHGPGLPIAYEGALKIKEVAYVHAEGLAAGELKHGVLALIDQGFPVIGIVLGDGDEQQMFAALSEAHLRGAMTIALVADGIEIPDGKIDTLVRLPRTHPWLMPLLAAVPLQLLAYHASVSRGFNPDRPRNLAKSVTVK